MNKKIKDSVEYREKIIDIPLYKIELNRLNPRKRFVDSEEDVLIESILSKGLLNPIIVYKRKIDNMYIILDGERRFRAYKKLNKKDISCHILENEPTELENLSLMFHIHNVRVEWTDFAIGQTILKIVLEMGKDPKELTRYDRLELSTITSLSEYKVKKYLIFFDFPNSIIKKFMESEMQEVPIKGMDPDILAEMHGPLKIIERELPEFLKIFNKEKIIDVCVKKKAHGIIKTNREFRLFKKILSAMKTGSISKEVIQKNFVSFVNQLEVTPQQIFERTSETIYKSDLIVRKILSLVGDINDLEFDKLSVQDRERIKESSETLTRLIKHKSI